MFDTMQGREERRDSNPARTRVHRSRGLPIWAFGGLVFAGAFLALAGCEAPEGDPMEDMPMEEAMDRPMAEMEMDPGMMERHADEAEAMASEVEDHVEAIRGRSPGEQQERMGTHAERVSRMLGLLNRQMREMSMGMQMDDEAMGRMMGMSAEEHRRMRDEMTALRGEVEELQVAAVDEIRERMPAHLDRLDAMAGMLREMAEGMREM